MGAMAERLIITNGDSAAARMIEAKIPAEILPWRDILHEGPVPADLGLEALSTVRAQFLAERGWISEDQLRGAFLARDQLLRRHHQFRTVVLWFEHDLADQLQLLQVLDFFAQEQRRDRLYLIQAAKYLGQETPRALKAHLQLMEPVQDAHLALAKATWRAFRSETPEAWAALLPLNTRVLPFLRLALLRLLEELPAPHTGLSRTEATILKLIANGTQSVRDLYAAFVEHEDPVFMGDWSFYHHLDQLGAGGAPLVAGFNGLQFSPQLQEPVREAYLGCKLSVTNLGYSVLNGGADALMHRRVNRPIGGYVLTSDKAWRWDERTQRLIGPV